MTEGFYPKTYAQWGGEGIRKINQLMPLAAEKVSSFSPCDKVSIVELSLRSSPGGNIVFFVDCKNNERFYISENELTSSSPILTQTEKMRALSNFEATQACEKAIKSKLNYPLSFKKLFFINFIPIP